MPLIRACLLLRDCSLRLRRDLRPVRSEADHAVLDAAVVEVRLPGSVQQGLGLAQVVGAPVVDRSGQPLLRSELARVRVVAHPRNALRLRVLTGSRTVDVLTEDVRAGRDEALCRLLLLAVIEPGVRPDQSDLCAGVRRLRTERERVGVPDDLRNRERDDVPDDALLRCGTCRHSGEVDPVLSCAEVLRHVLGLGGARCHLELHVRVLLRRCHHRRLKTERRGEDDLVAVSNEALDDLRGLRAFRHELLVRRLDLGAELLLHVQAALVVCLRPAVVVVRTDVDPGGLERRGFLLRPRRAGRDAERQEQRDDERERQGKSELPFPHVLLSPVPGVPLATIGRSTGGA